MELTVSSSPTHHIISFCDGIAVVCHSLRRDCSSKIIMVLRHFIFGNLEVKCSPNKLITLCVILTNLFYRTSTYYLLYKRNRSIPYQKWGTWMVLCPTTEEHIFTSLHFIFLKCCSTQFPVLATNLRNKMFYLYSGNPCSRSSLRSPDCRLTIHII